jgi:hypothetical protein
MVTYTLTIAATITTIAYNVIKIYKELKIKKTKKNEIKFFKP